MLRIERPSAGAHAKTRVSRRDTWGMRGTVLEVV